MRGGPNSNSEQSEQPRAYLFVEVWRTSDIVQGGADSATEILKNHGVCGRLCSRCDERVFLGDDVAVEVSQSVEVPLLPCAASLNVDD